MAERYEDQAKGIRIIPGQWRPHYPWEHIAWISPSWPSQDYIWLDSPEAIFTDQGLLYLSHINPPIPQLFENLPKVPWTEIEGGIRFERTLPNGVSFGQKVTKAGEDAVALELWIRNRSQGPLTNIKLQTCSYLRAIKEFADYTMSNKYVHVAGRGWTVWEEALKVEGEPGSVKLGWRGGKKIADKPMLLVLSNQGSRCASMTWFEDTGSLVGNSKHPCFHADPVFKDLEPGEEATIRGEIRFHAELPEGVGG